MVSYTNNFNFVLQQFNDNSGTWGTTGSGGEPGLNSGIFTPLDAILGGNYTAAISAGNNSLSLTNWVSAGIFILTGTLTNNATFILPLSPNSVGSATAVGGKFVVVNATTGAYGVTVQTAATGSIGVNVPQGFVTSLYSDTVNVNYANIGLPAFAQASNGNPNGQVAGTAGSVNTNAELAWDYTNSVLYVCTTTGSSSGAVWTNPVLSGQTLPELQGRLTPKSGTPVIYSDVTGASANTIYYTPYTGAWAAYHNGTSIVPFRFSQMQLSLSSSQAVNQIYDVFLAYNSGTPVIGTGPSWAAGTSGSVSAGACARGTGSGGAAISRDSTTGLWVNTAIMSIVYNNGSISGTLNNVPAGQLIYLGSIFIDSGSAGQASCYLSYGGGGGGPPRKFGVWNAYNRLPIKMLGGSSISSWTYGVNGWRQSDADTNNQVIAFTGLAEEPVDIDFKQLATLSQGKGAIGIGINSTSSPSGMAPVSVLSGSSVLVARYVQQPQFSSVAGQSGITAINMLENSEQGVGNQTFNGLYTNMLMTVSYNG